MSLIVGVVLGVGILFGLVSLSENYKAVENLMDKVYKVIGIKGIIIACFIPAFIFSHFTYIPYTYSDGVKSGSLTKFTKKGLLFKTWEGQLNLGGMVPDGDGGMVANTWEFSVTDPKVIEKLNKANGRVNLVYDQHLLVPIYMGSSTYLIKDIK